ncbi:hypothetical protein DL769_005320 [Monosporascus sp. CRB-8-3]|nr:hypothetical protein DL769_005320 [Monosporascus sp. CRB-8-3]
MQYSVYVKQGTLKISCTILGNSGITGTSKLTTLHHGSHLRALWNLQDTYGIDSETYELRQIAKRCAASTSPSRQGSPRIPDGVVSAGYLYKRALIPWSGPRRLGWKPEVRMFFIYKLMSREIKYWKEVAAERKAEGSWACARCAKVEVEMPRECVICHECSKAAEDEEFDWFRNSLRNWFDRINQRNPKVDNLAQHHMYNSPLRITSYSHYAQGATNALVEKV